MQIEYPEFPPVALAVGPVTIGAFYDTIAEGFTTVNPTINPNAFAVNSGEAIPIKSIADALAAISLIKGEGEANKKRCSCSVFCYLLPVTRGKCSADVLCRDI